MQFICLIIDVIYVYTLIQPCHPRCSLYCIEMKTTSQNPRFKHRGGGVGLGESWGWLQRVEHHVFRSQKVTRWLDYVFGHTRRTAAVLGPGLAPTERRTHTHPTELTCSARSGGDWLESVTRADSFAWQRLQGWNTWKSPQKRKPLFCSFPRPPNTDSSVVFWSVLRESRAWSIDRPFNTLVPKYGYTQKN